MLAEMLRSWKAAFENYFVATNLKNQSKDVQVATLLHCAGPAATDIFATFTFHGDDEKDNYKHVFKKFAVYCERMQNELFEIYRLLHRQRIPGESLESWIKRRTRDTQRMQLCSSAYRWSYAEGYDCV